MTLREHVASLRADGMGYKRISQITGVPVSTVRRWANPSAAERDRATSRAWKARVSGRCRLCGRVTGYHGDGKRASDLCVTCYEETRPRASHGTRSKYNSGCRCDECKRAHAYYMREFYRRRKAAA